jgi:hypothetical protein
VYMPWTITLRVIYSLINIHLLSATLTYYSSFIGLGFRPSLAII